MDSCASLTAQLGEVRKAAADARDALASSAKYDVYQKSKARLQTAYDTLQAMLHPLPEALVQTLEPTLQSMEFFGYPEQISREQILADLRKLPKETLDYIMTWQEPVILLTPAGTLPEKMDRVDVKLKSKSNGVLESKTYFMDDAMTALWTRERPTLLLSIVEGAKEGKRSTKTTLKESYEEAAEVFKRYHAMNISMQEYAMLAQRALFLSGEGTDNAVILDRWTLTMFCLEDGRDTKMFPCGNWNSAGGRFRFSWYDPDHVNVSFRGRPSVQVGEY